MNFSPDEDNLGLIFMLYEILNSKKTFSLIEIKKKKNIGYTGVVSSSMLIYDGSTQA